MGRGELHGAAEAVGVSAIISCWRMLEEPGTAGSAGVRRLAHPAGPAISASSAAKASAGSATAHQGSRDRRRRPGAAGWGRVCVAGRHGCLRCSSSGPWSAFRGHISKLRNRRRLTHPAIHPLDPDTHPLGDGGAVPTTPSGGPAVSRHGAAIVAMTATITKMAKHRAEDEQHLLLAVRGVRFEYWHTPSLAPALATARRGQPGLRPVSGPFVLDVRLRPARTPTTICGTIRAAISAIGSPQPPLCW